MFWFGFIAMVFTGVFDGVGKIFVVVAIFVVVGVVTTFVLVPDVCWAGLAAIA